uniref:Ig-like domain-containing protein n=1 Tax=Mesocestoides corti TaxID=53468 RepID=A0A5K3FC48_MESCO
LKCHLSPTHALKFSILVPPKITKAPAPTLKVVEGDGLQVSCSAEGNPTPVVSWMMKLAKGGIRIVPAHFDTDGFEYARDVLKGLGATFVEMNGYLQISQINRQMSGTLVCQAVNGIEPKAIRKSKLDIRFTPEVNVVNSLIKQSLGGDTVLQCLVNANPIGNVVWTFGKAMIPINAPSCSVPTSKTVKYCTVELRRKNEERWSSIVSKLHILKLTEQDFGEYTCGMATMMGRHAASTKLERYVSESEYPMKLLNDPFFNMPLQATTETSTAASTMLHLKRNRLKDMQYGPPHFRETRLPVSSRRLRNVLLQDFVGGF